MNNMQIIQFYIPLIIFILLIFFAIKGKFGNNAPFITFSQYGLDLIISNKNAIKIFMIFSGFISLLTYTQINIADYFPTNYDMQVFYDKKGLNNNLTIFTEEELQKLGYQGEASDDVSTYFKLMDEKIKQTLHYRGFFSVRNGIVHSKGTTSFKIQKTKGLQEYYIEESKGELLHTMEIAGKKSLTFMSFFEKLPSNKDYIRPTIKEMLINQEIVLAPKFKQIVAEKNKSDGSAFDHILIGVTKVYLLPYPHYSNTVYFLETINNNLVPIGYAIYK